MVFLIFIPLVLRRIRSFASCSVFKFLLLQKFQAQELVKQTGVIWQVVDGE